MGNTRAPYPPLHALLASPWYAIGHFVLARIPGIPVENRDLVVSFAVTLSSATFAALASVLALKFFLRIGATLKSGLVATFLIALATPLFAYSGWFFSEPLASVFLIGAVMVLFGHPQTKDVPPSAWGASLAGALLGAALFVRPAHVIAVPPILTALLVQHRTKGIRPALRVGAVVAIAAAGYLLWNWHLYGSAFEFGYPPFAEGGRRLNSFETPIYLGLWGFLFSPGKSVFLFAPPVSGPVRSAPHVVPGQVAGAGLRFGVDAYDIPAFLFGLHAVGGRLLLWSKVSGAAAPPAVPQPGTTLVNG